MRKEIWNKVKIENVASIVGGGTPSRSKPDYFKGNNLWIGPTEIPKDRIRIITETNEKLTDEAIQKSSAKMLPIGTILFTTRATVGEVAIAGKEIATSQSLENFVCNPEKN
ncbi:MAG: restriction endonuclease subunit S [Bacteroidetes bacterium]|nr:restriction endonuclease subunit S [Bacteroidota bacterium]